MSSDTDAAAIGDRLSAVRQGIADACARVGRDPAEVALVAVSKTKPVELIRAAYAAGQRDFGENYAQELRHKVETLSDLSDIRWHFIGPLQRNKVKIVVGHATLLHSIERVDQIDAVEKRAATLDVVQQILLQVNLSGEQTKAGTTEQQTALLLRACEAAPHVRCVGLMTMPPLAEDPRQSATYFEQLRQLRDELGGPTILPHLSMGMTHDFAVAIAHGATLVRVGTAIFGARQYRNPSI